MSRISRLPGKASCLPSFPLPDLPTRSGCNINAGGGSAPAGLLALASAAAAYLAVEKRWPTIAAWLERLRGLVVPARLEGAGVPGVDGAAQGCSGTALAVPVISTRSPEGPPLTPTAPFRTMNSRVLFPAVKLDPMGIEKACSEVKQLVSAVESAQFGGIKVSTPFSRICRVWLSDAQKPVSEAVVGMSPVRLKVVR